MRSGGRKRVHALVWPALVACLVFWVKSAAAACAEEAMLQDVCCAARMHLALAADAPDRLFDMGACCVEGDSEGVGLLNETHWLCASGAGRCQPPATASLVRPD